jgi:hypothetical protein
MVVSMVALFVAMSGAGYAAIKANSVGAKQIKTNGVRSAEIQDGAVGTAEVADGSLTGRDIQDESIGSPDVTGLGSGDITDNTLGSNDIGDNAVGSGEITDESVTTDDIANGSLAGIDVANETLGTDDVGSLTRGDFAAGELPPQMYARVGADAARTLQVSPAGFPPQVSGLVQANVVPGEAAAATGTTCFDLPSRPASALVSLDNADAAAANRNLVTSVAIDRGEDLGDCPAAFNDARVRIVDGNTETATDARFFVWFIS